MSDLKKSKSFLEIIREEVNKNNAKSNDFKTKTHEDLLDDDTNISINNGFRVPNDSDLFDNGINNGKINNAGAYGDGFKIPNDEDLLGNEINNNKRDNLGSYSSIEEVQRYLDTIVSSRSDYDMSRYVSVSSGNSIVGIDELNEMLMDGYIITKAECLLVNPSMISIVYKKLIDKSEIGKRR